MAIPTTVKQEYLRAIAAEKALSDRIAQLEIAATTPPTIKVAPFTPTMTAAQFLAILADNTIDVIELSGVYKLPQIAININRTRSVTVRPASGAIATFLNTNCPSGNQFGFGVSSVAGLIRFENLIFDGYYINDTGLLWVGNTHDITLNKITVLNCTAGLSASSSWALYVSSDGAQGSTNFTANDWFVDGNTKKISALTSYHNPNGHVATFRNWEVNNVGYALYFNSDINGVTLDGWSVNNAGVSGYNGVESIIAVGSPNAGTISNFRVTNGGGVRIPSLVNAGGNVW